jgi:hypothetical protein
MRLSTKRAGLRLGKDLPDGIDRRRQPIREALSLRARTCREPRRHGLGLARGLARAASHRQAALPDLDDPGATRTRRRRTQC